MSDSESATRPKTSKIVVEIAEERRATVPEKPERFKFRQNIRRGLRAAFGKDLRNAREPVAPLFASPLPVATG
ncbi:hypothetical protein QR680_009883 [Steinernema hermaphroditum]|uniref:Uncharacterized protein n=1 Tax=Steinernema hermaphroditum TaxID=289476 RepID=A0AA39ILZ8_9BILA|nr:hypothetical protein QR680_009883 [Steinernema hermaphroditum]